MSPLPEVSIATPAQLRLQVGTDEVDIGWEELPEATRAAALMLLAGLIGKLLVDVGDADG